MSAHQSSAVLKVDFKRRPYENVGRGVYKDPRTGAFYERPKISGKYTWRKLESAKLRFAEEEVARNRSNQRLAPKGLAHDPYKRSQAMSIGELCQFYLDAGCPKARSKSQRAP